MKRMAARVEVVDYYFDCVVVVYDLSIGGIAIDDWVCGSFSDAQGRVERGHFRFSIRDVVDSKSNTMCQ